MPSGNEVTLDRELLERLFEQLDAELEKNGARARVYVVGGARMTLGLRDGRTTRDADVTFRDAEGPVNEAVETVAERNNLAKDWLNTAAVKMLPTSPDAGETTLYEGRRLTIVGASAERMLATKVMAMRAKDHEDIRRLMNITGIREADKVEALMQKAYVNEQPGAGMVIALKISEFSRWLEREKRMEAGTAERKPVQQGGDPKVGAPAARKSVSKARAEDRKREKSHRTARNDSQPSEDGGARARRA